MLNDVVVTKAKIEDLNELYLFEREIFDYDELSKKQIRHHILHKKNKFFVAKYLGQIIGYCLVFFVFGKKRYGRIYSIAITPKFQNKKIATEFIKHAFAEIKKNKIEKIFLEVLIDNLAAINFYKKFGFEIIRVIPGYYKSKGDALKMQKIM